MHKKLRIGGALVVCVVGMGTARVAADDVSLENGDRLSGMIVMEDDAQVTLEHATLGKLTIPKASVKSVSYTVSETQAKAQAAAQKAKEAKQAEEAKARAWKREIEAGYALTRGNTHTQVITGRLKADRTVGHHEFNSQAEYLNSEAKRKMDAQRYSGMLRYARKFGRRLRGSNFYKLDGTHDRFANIDWRLSPTVGLGYTLVESSKGKALVEGGAGWEHTKFRDSTPSRDEAVVTTRAYAEANVFARSKLSEDFTTVHPLGFRFGEFRLKSETALTNPLSDRLSLRLSLVDEFNSDPTGEAKRNDLRLTSSLVYAF